MFPPQNPELKPESLWNYEISWSQRLLNGRFSYGANLYYVKGENMIQTMPVDGRPLNVNTGEIENMGVELNVNCQISKSFSILSNYSWLKMENPVLAAPEHKLYVGIDYNRKWFGFSTGAHHFTSFDHERTLI